MKLTQTNGNSRNRITGSRISIFTDKGTLVARVYVRSMFGGLNYIRKHPNGEPAQQFRAACKKALELDRIEKGAN